MEPQDLERLAKLQAIELASQAEREASALVIEAAKKHHDLTLAYYGADQALSAAQYALWGEFQTSNVLLSGGPAKPKPPELTQREHEVWLTAYSKAHASAQQAELAAKSARLAVEAYRALVNGTGADG